MVTRRKAKPTRLTHLLVAALSALGAHLLGKAEPRVPEAAWALPWLAGALAAASLVAVLLWWEEGRS